MSNQIPPVSPDGQSLEYKVPVQQPQPVPAQSHIADHGYRAARDRAQYVRQQKGHSWLLGWLILGPLTCFIVPLYWTFSPNHYWHL